MIVLATLAFVGFILAVCTGIRWLLAQDTNTPDTIPSLVMLKFTVRMEALATAMRGLQPAAARATVAMERFAKAWANVGEKA